MSAIVIRSIQNSQGDRCVDIFRRPDATYGFEEWRRDPEDAGWRRIGHFGHAIYHGEHEALAKARAAIGWLSEAIDGQG